MTLKILRWTGFGVLGVATLALLVALTLFLLGSRKLSRVHTGAGRPVTVTVNAETLARGEHLVRSVSGCADCHGTDLGGQLFLDEPGFATIYAPNLTTGRGGVDASRTAAGWERALRQGVAHDGRALAPMMPSEATQNLSDADLGAVVAYLRSVPPVDTTVPEPEYGPVARLLTGAGIFPLAPDLVARTERLGSVPAVAVSAPYGGYLARIAGCTTCHGASLAGGEHPAHPGLRTPNLTSGPASSWSLAEFRQTLRTGRTPDGTLLARELMPWPMYAGMTDDEVAALHLYLGSLRPSARAD